MSKLSLGAWQDAVLGGTMKKTFQEIISKSTASDRGIMNESIHQDRLLPNFLINTYNIWQ